MVFTHHSRVACENCGTKHIPGNTEACIETLKEQVTGLKADNRDLETANAVLRNKLDAALDRAVEAERFAAGCTARGGELLAERDRLRSALELIASLRDSKESRIAQINLN